MRNTPTLKLLCSFLLAATSLFHAGGSKAQSVVVREYFASYTDFSDIEVEPEDDRLADLVANTIDFRDKSAYALVKIGIDPDMDICYGASAKYKVVVRSEETIVNMSGSVLMPSPQFYTLTVSYDPLLRTVDSEEAFVAVQHGRALKLTIVEVKAVNPYGSETSVPTPDLLPPDLYIEGEIVRDRYPDFNPTLPGSVPSFYTISGTTLDNIYQEHNVHFVSWSNVPGAIEYELEWTHEDNYEVGGLSGVKPAAQVQVNFRNNASSVRVPRKAANSFYIPDIYGRGHLVFRVRAIGRGGAGLDEDIFGQWSLNDGLMLSAVAANNKRECKVTGTSSLYNGFNNLNAQYSIQFAEEGKIMASATYADGTMRVLQNAAAVKIDYQDDYGKMAVITETMYDHMGRAAITTLPAVTKNGFWYTPNYNRGIGGNKYGYLDFDTDQHLADGCVTGATPMDSTSGSSMYYSSSNPYKNEHQGLVAGAKGYPFIQNSFERDNTGRPKLQSGVGETHRMGNGHETKYIYGGAEAVQINRLFGTDAGYAEYYQKNMVVDANGQISITYTDMAGRTVATALAGKVPNNVNALTDDAANILADAGDIIVDDMLNLSTQHPNGSSNMLSPDGMSYTLSKTLLVDKDQEYLFSYSAELAEFQDSCFTFCLDCIYDLEISVTDECGKYHIGTPDSLSPLRMTIGGNTLDTLCNDTNGMHLPDFEIRLKPGAYTVYKRLSVNEDSMTVFVEKMLANSTCMLSLEDFYEAPDTAGCHITCESCMANIGTWEEFFTPEKIDSAFGGDSTLAHRTLWPVYVSMKQDCEALCTSENSRDFCAGIYALMLMDVSPGGQYGEYLDSLGTPMGYPLSVYNHNNALSFRKTSQIYPSLSGASLAAVNSIDGQTPTWRRPVYYDPGNTSEPYKIGYYDIFGDREKVYVQKDANDIFMPQVVNPSLVYVVNEEDNHYYTYHENLALLEDFMDNRPSQVAKSLVIYHPEFIQYAYCVSIYPHTTTVNGQVVNTFTFDGALTDMTYADASTLLGNPSTISGLLAAMKSIDPYFSHPLVSLYHGTMLPDLSPEAVFDYRFQNYQELPPNTVDIAQMVYIQNACGYSYPTGCTMPGTVFGGQIHDEATWQIFLNYYTSLKQEVILYAMNHHAFFGATPDNAGTWNVLNGECIGNSSYFPAWSANNPTAALENPCNFPLFVFYWQKQRRINSTSKQISEHFGLSEPPNAEELEQYALQGYYNETGKCVMVSDLEFLLGKLVIDRQTTNGPPKLTAGLLNLSQGGYMGVSLYGELAGTGDVMYSASVSGNTLTATGGDMLCTLFELTLPAQAVTAGYTFDDIRSMFVIGNIVPDVGTDHTFSINAVFYNATIGVPETLAVAGTTCLPLTGCEVLFRSVCKPTPTAKDLMNLLSFLSMEGDLFHTGTPLVLGGSAYDMLITQRLKVYLGNDAPYEWLYDATNEKFILSAPSGSIELNVPSPGLGLNPSDRYEFISVRGSQTTTAGNAVYSDFTFSAKKVDMVNYLPSSVNPNPVVTMNGNVGVTGIGQTFPITKCEEIAPLGCNTVEHKNLRDLQEILELDIRDDADHPFYFDTCFTIDSFDSLFWDNSDDIFIISVRADMERSVNKVSSEYFILEVKNELGLTSIVKAKYCKTLRNCDECKDPENEICDESQTHIKIGPLSSFAIFPESYYSIGYTGEECTYIGPGDFQYTQGSPSAFWEEWAQAIRDNMGPTYTVSIANDYMTIAFDPGETKCRCNDGEFFNLHGDEGLMATFPVSCCEDETPCAEETIMDFPSFPDGWFANQNTFSQVFWTPTANNSLIYEENDMLIFENKCRAFIHTGTLNWDTDAIYRISCQFELFETPDPVGDVVFTIMDGSGNWLDAIHIDSDLPQTIYYTAPQSDIQFAIDIQNVDWDIPGGLCTGESKVGLKYLRIEKIPAPYHMAYHPTNGYGITPELILTSGGDIDGIEIFDDHDDIGIYTSGEVSGDKIILSSRCGAGMTYEFETCPGYEHEFEITVGVPDSAYAPTHVYVLIFAENGGDYVGVFGPYLPGTIRETFTPDADLVSIATVAVNAHTEPDFMDILEGMGSFDEYCGDSVRFTIENYILSKGCTTDYACGEGPPPCHERPIFSLSDFPDGWFLEQNTFSHNSYPPGGNSQIYEEDGNLVLLADCAIDMEGEITGAVPGSLYKVSISAKEYGLLPPPHLKLQFGTTSMRNQYMDRTLQTQGNTEFYFTAPASSWTMNIVSGRFSDSDMGIVCHGSTTVGIEYISVAKVNDAHIYVPQYESAGGLDSATLAIPGITLGDVNLYTEINEESGFYPTEIKIQDGKIHLGSSCASLVKFPIDLCKGETYQAEFDLGISDPSKAPTHWSVVTSNYVENYSEVSSGTFHEGVIQFEFTPLSEYVELYLLTVRSNTSPDMYGLLNGEVSMDEYCTDSVAYTIKGIRLLNPCAPSYVCTFGPAEGFSPWESSAPISVPQDCHPEILPFPTDTTRYENPCVQYLLETAQANADYRYRQYLEEKRAEYRQLYIEKCMNPVRETLDRTYTDGQYHYTLYYYDRAGNLTKTVPPHAVEPLTGSELSAVNDARDNNTVMVPKHNRTAENSFALTTRYRYNSLNQPTEQQTPDGGTSSFYYDRLGRVSVSRNAVQQGNGRYSYTLYDPLGRITEVGEFSGSSATRSGIYVPGTQTAFFSAATGHAEVTRTFYDVPATGITFDAGFSQHNLRSRVSHTLARPLGETDFVFGTYYDYDIHGNVKALIHRNDYVPSPSLEQNLVEYDYDLVAGTVKKVGYNRHRADRYFHKYAYDDQNRLTHAYTSRNDIKYDLDAKYFYYRHGPLARTELGQNRVQGLDYAYTIHGWLKSVNSDALSESVDPGKDGNYVPGNPNANFARDAYGFSLHYYAGDYTPILASHAQTKILPGAYNAVSLFNGNISAMNNTLRKPDGHTVHPLLQRFGYDQLNRIAESVAFGDYDFTGNQWNASTPHMQEYATSYTYDPAGNLLTLNRNGDKSDTLEMDSLRYTYHPLTNRLMRVNDVVDAGNYAIDIDDQTGTNYDYDAIGNLVKDEAEEIEEIKWTVYGKVSEVKRYASSTRPDLKFYYDAGGKRIMKKVMPKNGAPEKTEYYVHDAQGNPLTIYSYLASDTPTYKVNEQMLYGSSRLGLWKSDVDLLAHVPEVPEVLFTDRGNKRYELNNHLGNVHAVLSDRRVRVCDDGTFEHYQADIRNTYDYYPFGMMMPGRNHSATVAPNGVYVCDTILDSVMVMMYDVDFDNHPASWTLDTHPDLIWYRGHDDQIAHASDGKLVMRRYHYSEYATYLMVPLPALESSKTYHYSFDYWQGTCTGANIDSVFFGVVDGPAVYLHRLNSSGPVTGSFVVPTTDEYYVAIMIDGSLGDSCTAYMDNFRMWTYDRDTSYAQCGYVVPPCIPDTTVTPVFAIQDGFSSWGGWSATGSALLTYLSSEIQVSNPSTSSNPIGAQKSFMGGTGQHTVSFDWEGNICGQYIVWPPAFNPSSVVVRVKDATNAVIASQTYTASSGSYSFSYTPAAAGTHTLEFYMASGTSLCYFRLDNVKVRYDSVSVTVCDTSAMYASNVSDSYRFLYQGQEVDNEIYVDYGAYSFEYRIHDPRLGRFLSVDPLAKNYPWNSPYAFAENRVIQGIDLEGQEFKDSKGQNVETNPSLELPNMGLTELEMKFVQDRANRGLIPFNTKEGEIPMWNASPDANPQAQEVYNKKFKITPGSTNNLDSWRTGTTEGLTPILKDDMKGFEGVYNAKGELSPALHNYFVQNIINYGGDFQVAGRATGTGVLMDQQVKDHMETRGVPENWQNILNHRTKMGVITYLSSKYSLGAGTANEYGIGPKETPGFPVKNNNPGSGGSGVTNIPYRDNPDMNQKGPIQYAP